MSSIITELRTRRKELFNKAEAIANRAAAENRALTDAEDRDFLGMSGEIDQIDTRIKDVSDGEQRAQDAAAVMDGFGVRRRHTQQSSPTMDAFRSAIFERNLAPIDIHDPSPRSGYSPGH